MSLNDCQGRLWAYREIAKRALREQAEARKIKAKILAPEFQRESNPKLCRKMRAG